MASTEVTQPSSSTSPQPAATNRSRRFDVPQLLLGADTASVVRNWIISRGIALALMATIGSGVTGDVTYYGRSLDLMFSGLATARETLQEYPLPVLGILVPQYLLGGMNPFAFAVLFAASMLAVDAAFTALLWKVGGRRRDDAVRLWLWFVPAIGPLAFFRFDLVPAVLAGAAVLAAIRRPGLTGALTAVGAALKLWPAVMLPIFLIRRMDRLRVLVSFVLTGAVIGGISLAVGGLGRLLSPLTWQSGRGLQIESLPASPLMLARVVTPRHWTVRISQYKAFEIFGPGVAAFEALSTVLSVVGLLVLALLWWRARSAPDASAETLGWLFVATTVIVTVTNKTLSPQYILWLGGPLCALMARSPGDAVIRRAAGQLLIISILTQIVFPVGYDWLTHDGLGMRPIALVLAVRNVLLVRLGWLACAQVWRQTRRSGELAAPA